MTTYADTVLGFALDVTYLPIHVDPLFLHYAFEKQLFGLSMQNKLIIEIFRNIEKYEEKNYLKFWPPEITPLTS